MCSLSLSLSLSLSNTHTHIHTHIMGPNHFWQLACDWHIVGTHCVRKKGEEKTQILLTNEINGVCHL